MQGCQVRKYALYTITHDINLLYDGQFVECLL